MGGPAKYPSPGLRGCTGFSILATVLWQGLTSFCRRRSVLSLKTIPSHCCTLPLFVKTRIMLWCKMHPVTCFPPTISILPTVASIIVSVPLNQFKLQSAHNLDQSLFFPPCIYFFLSDEHFTFIFYPKSYSAVFFRSLTAFPVMSTGSFVPVWIRLCPGFWMSLHHCSQLPSPLCPAEELWWLFCRRN